MQQKFTKIIIKPEEQKLTEITSQISQVLKNHSKVKFLRQTDVIVIFFASQLRPPPLDPQ